MEITIRQEFLREDLDTRIRGFTMDLLRIQTGIDSSSLPALAGKCGPPRVDFSGLRMPWRRISFLTRQRTGEMARRESYSLLTLHSIAIRLPAPVLPAPALRRTLRYPVRPVLPFLRSRAVRRLRRPARRLRPAVACSCRWLLLPILTSLEITFRLGFTMGVRHTQKQELSLRLSLPLPVAA